MNAMKTSFTVVMLSLLGQTKSFAKSEPWQLGFPEPVTPLAEQMEHFHNVILMPVITGIVVFVLGLILFVCWRFSAKRNPVPSKTTHNTMLEIIWTGVPVVILALLFIPSMKVLYMTDTTGEPDMTLKVTGYQWYWAYEYPDYDNFGFDSIMVEEDELPQGQKHLYRMLTDNVVVVPTDRRIRVQVTAADVLHNWAISDFGIRVDAVPGRLNEAWMEITKPGTYYGFCSELCGVRHAFMPITIEAMEPAEFDAWVEQAREQFATDNNRDDNLNIADSGQ